MNDFTYFRTENGSSQDQNLALTVLFVLDSGTLIVLLGCRQWLLSVFTWGNIHPRPSPLRLAKTTGVAPWEARHTLVNSIATRNSIATPCLLEKKSLKCFGAPGGAEAGGAGTPPRGRVKYSRHVCEDRLRNIVR